MILVDCVCGGRLALTLSHRVLCLAQVRSMDQGDRRGGGDRRRGGGRPGEGCHSPLFKTHLLGSLFS